MPRRLFVAIDLPQPVGWRLARLIGEPPRGVRPVRPGQLHLTLHFLGDVADATHAAIGGALEACGLEVERRAYVPHVTLARLTPAVPWAWTSRFLADTAGLVSDAIPVDRFLLYDSRKRDGSTAHAIEASFPLRPNRP